MTAPTIASEQASRFATRRPDFEAELVDAFNLWLIDHRWYGDTDTRTMHSMLDMLDAGARWEQWERTHKVAA